jgi:hypothetical protein
VPAKVLPSSARAPDVREQFGDDPDLNAVYDVTTCSLGAYTLAAERRFP